MGERCHRCDHIVEIHNGWLPDDGGTACFECPCPDFVFPGTTQAAAMDLGKSLGELAASLKATSLGRFVYWLAEKLSVKEGR